MALRLRGNEASKSYGNLFKHAQEGALECMASFITSPIECLVSGGGKGLVWSLRVGCVFPKLKCSKA